MSVNIGMNMEKEYRIPDTAIKEKDDKNKKYELEDAIRLAGHGKFQTIVIIFTGLSIMGAVLENISVSFVLPYAKCDLKLTTSEQGLLNSVSFLGIVISSQFWGFMADTSGRRKVIRISLICSFICSFASAFATTTNYLLLFRFLVGLFASGVQAGAFSYISEFHTRATAPRAASFATMFLPGVFLYMPIVAFILIPMDWTLYISTLKFTPWRLFLICASMVNVVNFIVFCLLPESPKFLLLMNRKEETLAVLRKMYSINTGKPKDLYPVNDVLSEGTSKQLGETKGFVNIMKLVWNQTKPIFVPPYLDKTLKLSYIMFIVFSIGHGTFMWFPDFLVQLQNNIGSGKTLCEIVGHKVFATNSTEECIIDNKSTVSFQIVFIVGIVFVTLSALISFYLNRLGAKQIISIWLVVSAITGVSLVFLTEFYSIVISFVLFLSCSICASIVSAISVNLFSTNIRAMATCCILMFGRIGGVVGSNLVGILLEDHCNLIFYMFAAFLMSCIIVFLLIR